MHLPSFYRMSEAVALHYFRFSFTATEVTITHKIVALSFKSSAVHSTSPLSQLAETREIIPNPKKFLA
jgi:hypothetical protein